MTNAALKARLKRKLDKEEDRSILRSIEILLRDETKEEAIKRRMHKMAVLSNEAIANGNVMTLDQAKARLKTSLMRRRAQRDKTKKRA